ncbi:MAG: DNA polymerase III subunit alpha [Bacteroidetes bacterium]|nr:MAG: DNA polymerase III subunit alpha [Bacteroidota bacterium]RLD89048.1 MAG: DNA polymerase III subunit alpha [Bacteroidota bacterium]
MFLIYDTETTGLPKDYNAPLTDFDNWPRVIQIAWQLHDTEGKLIEAQNFIIKPEGFVIPRGSEKIHGISTDRAIREGHELSDVLNEFNKVLQKATVVAGHNIEFDNNITGAEFLRKEMKTSLFDKKMVDTIPVSTAYCQLPGGKYGKFKWPTLEELHEKLFDEPFVAAHNAAADVQATARCFLELIRLGLLKADDLGMTQEEMIRFREVNPEMILPIGLDVQAFHEEEKEKETDVLSEEKVEKIDVSEVPFTHLHVHTQFSVLDGLSSIPKLMEKAKADGMGALAITDHGNMFGAKKFHDIAKKEGVKPILGCEVYVARRSMQLRESKEDRSGWHLVLLAKNETGYRNLIKLVSMAWTKGQYYKPRIDKELLQQYNEGLIALTACLGGEVPDKIMNEGEEKAERALLEMKELFGEDLYLELQRHPTGDPEVDKKVYDDQVYVNNVLLAFSKKHGVKVVATNDVHFVDKEDAGAHDRLICIGTAKDLDDPRRLRYTQQEWFKTQAEMKELFADIPEAIANTAEVAAKVEIYELNHDPLMPEFTIPEPFTDANEYLKQITYEGAKERYGEVSKEISERLDFELETIKKMGFPDYFLIVWDFLKAARELGVSVGPGRGSAAGSAVAYCLKITDIDPLKYNLLFERFLNPDRISMPDIDIDFDDDGRDKILKWVAEKYGRMRVAHLITFGTMAAKMAIRDVARVQKLPLSEADRLAKLVPDGPGVNLENSYKAIAELKKELATGTPEVQSVLVNALRLEGSVRNIGTHACGIIIGREDLYEYVPLSSVKDSVLDIATQYDGKFVESIGLLKMDFLGLKTLSIIKDTILNIKKSKGIELDMETIPFDDKETYELYSRGETTALFQFESDGMQKYLKELKPTRFEDLIAMNALYRPGPMQYIPNFINRKHGKEKIVYDIPIMEEILKETYGITVYQEQVMLLSRKMAGFTRGESDSLRKAMGKKQKAVMEKLKVKFIEGCEKNGLPKEKVEKVWTDWQEFAKYAFNKSHATCYSHLSYQTAYLKTHYPAEFMAANLSRNLHDIKKITQLIREANRMGIEVLQPDINESSLTFTVTKDGVIRFGMGAIKGVGESAVEQIVEERETSGLFKNIFDFAKRVNLRSINKRSFEALAKAGAFDSFPGTHRAQYFCQDDNGSVFIEKVIQYGHAFQERANSQQSSLFGDMEGAFEMKDPEMPVCQPWTLIQQLRNEKEVTGFYISGHPLDDYQLTIDRFCTIEIAQLKQNLKKWKDQTVKFAGMITKATEKLTKKGDQFGIFTLEDFNGSIDLMLFSEDYLKKKHLLDSGNNIFVVARVEERYNQPGNFALQVKDLLLLNDVINKYSQKITLRMEAPHIDKPFIKKLKEVITKNSGTCKLELIVEDSENAHAVTLHATGAGVDPRQFIDEITGFEHIRFSIS